MLMLFIAGLILFIANLAKDIRERCLKENSK